MKIVEVILPLNLPENLFWSVPEELIKFIKIGIRVEIMLGVHKKYSGIVKNILEESKQNFVYKPIIGVIDEYPIVTAQQIILWTWMANYYLCNEGEILQAALPNYLKLNSQTSLIFNPQNEFRNLSLKSKDGELYHLLATQLEINLQGIEKELQIKSATKLVQKFIKHEICFLQENLEIRYKPKLKTMVQFSEEIKGYPSIESFIDSEKLSLEEKKIAELFWKLSKDSIRLSVSEIISKYNISVYHINKWVKKKYLVKEKIVIDRYVKTETKDSLTKIHLAPFQKEAMIDINTGLQKCGICLLHGITGSGKTEVYASQILEKVENGGQALYLLPEIALTIQIEQRLLKYFGNWAVAVYHSKLNGNERAEIWQKVLLGKIKIILGSRSAIFLPFKELRLIIVDEEHDYSYKQVDPSPRYNGRDTALYLSQLWKIPLILGSATPSFESFFQAKQGKYAYVALTQRFGLGRLPAIKFINLTKENLVPKHEFITQELYEQISTTLSENKQVIVFHNRRGYDAYWLCGGCGFVPKCVHCNVNLTYHKYKTCLKCHYCNKEYPQPQACVQCGQFKFKTLKLGTEKICEILSELFPDYKVKRMDLETTRGKNSFERLIEEFDKQEINILVGTQMLVKGLDFKNVSLVAIFDADSLLYFNDFRVNERAFQLLEQVSGRAGRHNAEGIFAVQTRNSQHSVLQRLLNHDYLSVYKDDIKIRQEFHYPPFSRLLKIHTKHKVQGLGQEFLTQIFDHFNPYNNQGQVYIYAPVEPIINKIKNLYRVELIIKLPKSLYAIEFKKKIKNYCFELKKQPKFKSIIYYFDMDWV